MNQVYARVIEVLANGNIDLRQIGLELAKAHPLVFLEIASRTARPEWAVKVRHEMATGNKIMAIKLLRAAKNLGLKDAKDIVDCMHEDLYQLSPRGPLPPLGFDRPFLSKDLVTVYDEIMG